MLFECPATQVLWATLDAECDGDRGIDLYTFGWAVVPQSWFWPPNDVLAPPPPSLYLLVGTPDAESGCWLLRCDKDAIFGLLNRTVVWLVLKKVKDIRLFLKKGQQKSLSVTMFWVRPPNHFEKSTPVDGEIVSVFDQWEGQGQI